MLPIAISEEALSADVTDTTSSGALVIIATMVSPMRKSLMPKRLASATEPSVM